MKKILFLIVILFMPTAVFARCARPFDRSSCPTVACPTGTFMGDDGQCYSCDTDKSVGVGCMGREAFKICPNRIKEWRCKSYSQLDCKGRIEEIIDGEYIIHRCRTGRMY